MPGNLSVTEGIVQYLAETKTEDRIGSLVTSGRSLIAVFQDLNRIDSNVAQDLADILQSCEDRAVSFLKQLGGVSKSDESILSLHDQLVILHLILFSIYEQFYDRMLTYIMSAYLQKCGLISKEIASPHVFEEKSLITIEQALGGRNPLSDKYDFPVILRLLMASCEQMQAIFKSSAGLPDVEVKKEAIDLSDNLIASMAIRNRIAHMSEEAAYYSTKRVNENLDFLAGFFPLVLETLQRLVSFFTELHKEAPLSSHKRSGRDGLLQVLSERSKEWTDPAARKSIETALRRLQKTKNLSNEDLFKTES